ncbi:MAG: baseplate J/gp47 family protein [Succinivibrio sp.]
MPRISPRFGLASIDFLETDVKSILNNYIEKYNSLTKRSLAVSDPVYLLLESIAAEEAKLRADFNNAAKENLLSYATGDYLDAMGFYVNTPRLQASGSTTIIRFTLNETVADSVYQIPAGTVVTDGSNNFATDQLATIKIGTNYADVTATAVTVGSFTNGIAIGAINQLIEPLPNMESVSNLTITSGGSDMEEDDAYADRIRLAPSSFSVAGPQGAYRYHVYSYNSSIIDVSIYGLEEHPGNVYIHPLLVDGALPEQSFLEGLKLHLSDETIRPLTDNLIVTAPTPVNYTIELTWYLSSDDIDKINQITEDVKTAVENFRQWQQSKINRDITPDELTKLVMQAGAKRLVITSPSFMSVGKDEVAQCAVSDVVIHFGGTEEA